MSAAMVDTNPDYSRQIYEPRSRLPDEPVITSGLVSVSDDKHKERQQQIQWEMRRDYEEHMRRKQPVYYRTGSPEVGLPLGRYADARKVLDRERHIEYIKFMKEKEESSNRRRDEMFRRREASPPRQNPAELYDHNQMSQQLREERRREYNDFLDEPSKQRQNRPVSNRMSPEKQKEELELMSSRQPATPPGGLAIGGYDEYRNQLKADRIREYRESLLKQQNEQWFQRAKELQMDTSPEHKGHLDIERPLVGSPRDVIIDYKKLKEQLKEERKNEYNQLLEEKESHGTPRAPPTPPVGLNIPTEQERLRIAELKKKQYRDELLRQQKEQVLNRASHQLEIPVIDRRQQYPAAPPLNLQEDRPPSGRWNPDSYRQPNYAPKRVTSPPHQANIGHDDYGSFQRKQEQIIRNREYNELLAKQRQKEEEKHNKMEEMRRQAPAPIVKGDYYNAEEYEKRREYLHKQKHNDYQNFLKSQTPEDLNQRFGLPIGQQKYIPKQKWMEKQRNLEYNRFLRYQEMKLKKSKSPQSLTSLPMADSEFGNNQYQKNLEKVRNLEYNHMLKSERQHDRPPTPEYLQGLPLSQRQYDNMRKMQEKERNQEYNAMLTKPDRYSDRFPTPEFGFPLNQKHYDNMREMREKKRNKEYNEVLAKLDQETKRVPTPSFGFPLNQGPYDYKRKLQERMRNKEYNAVLAKLGFDKAHQESNDPLKFRSETQDKIRRRIINSDYGHSGFVNEVSSERHEEFKPPLSQRDEQFAIREDKSSSPKSSQEGLSSLITGDRVDYPSSANRRFNQERRREYNEYLKPQDLQNWRRKREEEIAKIESEGIDLDKVRIFPQHDSYQIKHKQFQDEWKRNFKEFAAKKHEIMKKQLEEKERALNAYYRKDVDSPAIMPAGEYKDRRKKFEQQWRDSCRDYYSGHPVLMRSKEIWKDDEEPKAIPQSGEYNKRREKLRSELREEFKQYQIKRTPPKERVKDFHENAGMVLFDPEYRGVPSRIREERRKDFKEFLEKQEAEKYARQENRNLENRIGFMANLGKPTNEMKEKLARERAEEYNRYLKNKYHYQGIQKPLERPKWLDPTKMEENWQKKDPSGEVRHPQENGIGRDSRSDHTAPRENENGRDNRSHHTPPREDENGLRRHDRSHYNAPREADYRQDREDYRSSGAYNQRSDGDRYRPMPSPSYQEMLENKRRAEASYRRYDDPEYPRYDDRY